jgi:hypothetical protein
VDEMENVASFGHGKRKLNCSMKDNTTSIIRQTVNEIYSDSSGACAPF